MSRGTWGLRLGSRSRLRGKELGLLGLRLGRILLDGKLYEAVSLLDDFERREDRGWKKVERTVINPKLP